MSRNVSTAALIALIGGALGVLLGLGFAYYMGLDHGSDSTTTSATTKATKKPTATKKTATKKTPEVATTRDLPVGVFNGGGIAGLATNAAAKAKAAGWTVQTISNWSAGVTANTVYAPQGSMAQGRLLAKDLGIAKVTLATSAMRTDRLTVIVVSAS